LKKKIEKKLIEKFTHAHSHQGVGLAVESHLSPNHEPGCNPGIRA
jgi:hypothetical protein